MKNIIFDCGNVLVRWDPEKILIEMGYSDEDIDLLLPGVFAGRRWDINDTGTQTAEEYARMCCDYLPKRLHSEAYRIMADWFKYLPPLPGMPELVRELKNLGYKIYLLSNISEEFSHFPEYVPAYECFDGMVFSGVERVIKPNWEIYERLLARYGLLPEDCLFIDDRQKNVNAALACGIPGYQFDGDVAKLRAFLEV